MSIMVVYGNQNKATILTDCRLTSTTKQGDTFYTDDAQKVCKYSNNTIIGIVGNANCANKIFDKLKPFIYSKISYESIYDLCLKYAQEFKDDERESYIAICGINKDHKIIIDFYNTDDFKHHMRIPDSDEYATLTYTNYHTNFVNAKMYQIINKTEDPNMISLNVHDYILEHIIPNDKTVSPSYCIETISL